MTELLPTRLEARQLAVRTSGIVKTYGRTRALDGVDLTVPHGAFYVLVGPNGSGKTSLLRILMGILRADSGGAEVLGVPFVQGALVRANVGYVPEKHEEPYGWMRVSHMLAHHAAYYRGWDGDYARELVSALDLRIDGRYGRLSKGESRRVQLAMALAHRPALLLLDEPTDGLDPVARDTVLGLLAEHLAASPATVIVSTHLTYEMERLADHIGVMRGGRLAAQLSRDDLMVRLRRYTFDVPATWNGGEAAQLGAAVLRRNGSAREARWTIWGDEADVRARLSAAGAAVREVGPITLDEAALALLGRKD
jgi:ABC-2 type transport system ATP-binding protein